MNLYYRVNDYHPFDIADSSVASSVRHRVNRVCRCLPDDINLTIFSILKAKSIKIIKCESHKTASNHRCITYIVPSNLFGVILKGLISIYLMLYLAMKLVRRDNFNLIYNLLPANILSYMFLSYIFPRLLKKTIFQIEELYSVYDFSFFKKKLTKIAENIVFYKGLNFIVVNENIKDLIKQKKAKSIVDYGYNSRSSKVIDIITSDSIIYTGRLDYVGGIEILLKALADLPLDIKSKVIITGNGGLKKKVISCANDVGINYRGYLTDLEYEALLLRAKISINPLRSKCKFSRYSFPSKVLQYLEYGCVVISSGVAQPELENFFADELLTYPNDDPTILNHLIKETDKLEFDKRAIIKKYQSFMNMKEKKMRTFFCDFLKGE